MNLPTSTYTTTTLGNEGSYAFSSYGEGYVAVNGVRYQAPLVLCTDELISQWTTHSFDTLDADDLLRLTRLDVEFIILGTGKQQRFLPPHLMRVFAEARKGLEVMDTHAACRTFNLLSSEGRRLAAAILLD